MGIKDKVKNLPTTPGVYLYKDGRGSIIYVGKAKNLKRRVASYFQNSKSHSPKVEKLVRHLKDFEYRLTDTEFEAFLLECKLIKEYQPLYNSKMKSSQSYTYIEIKTVEKLPSIKASRHPDFYSKNLYFGPYTSKNTVDLAIQAIKEYYKIYCNDPSRKNSLCLNYSLELCFGMCQGGPKVDNYNGIINKIIALLQGNDTSVIDELEKSMSEASKRLDFELAAKYRDYLNRIQYLVNKEKVIEFAEENQKVVVVEYINDYEMKLFLIEGNKVLYRRKYTLEVDNIEELCKEIKYRILNYFNKESHSIKIHRTK